MISAAEEKVLNTFRKYLITPGEMLCFSGINLEQQKATLDAMSEKDLLIKEKFKGGYSLTKEGFLAMRRCKVT